MTARSVGHLAKGRRGLGLALAMAAVLGLGLVVAIVVGLAKSGRTERSVSEEPSPVAAGPVVARSVGDREPQVNFLATADWGEPGPALTAVGKAMGERAAEVAGRGQKMDGVLLAGDNFYGHLSSVSDPAWEEIFEKSFPADQLTCPFYVTLGNQDYEEGKDAIELEYAVKNPASRWKMPGRWYRREFSAGGTQGGKPIASVLFLDSDVVGLGPTRFAEETRWLEAELAKPRVAPWLVLVAHHPVITGKQATPTDLLLAETWTPMFVKAGVNLYVHGHQHQLAHAVSAEMPGMTDVTVGGGGARLRLFKSHPSTLFRAESHGYAHLTLSATSADLAMYDENNRLLHSAVIKPGPGAQ